MTAGFRGWARVLPVVSALIVGGGWFLTSASRCDAGQDETCCTSIFGAECCKDNTELCCSAGIFGCSFQECEANIE